MVQSAREPTLTERQGYLLSLVVRDYIELGQPIGSAALRERYVLAVSPATVRAELGRLEVAGLLTHPHTSAGRVPTVAGYRYFVEHLMTSAGLSRPEQRTIRHQFHQAGADPESWVRLSAAVMAQTSGAAALVATTGHAPGAAAVPRLYHDGLIHILDVPEWADTCRLRDVVEILEHGLGLMPILSRLPAHGVQVFIGGEAPLEQVPQVTFVLARFGRTSRSAGVLGVVGPTRLPYERAVPAVGFVADLLTELLVGTAA